MWDALVCYVHEWKEKRSWLTVQRIGKGLNLMTLSQYNQVPNNPRALHILNIKIIVKNKNKKIKLPFNILEDRDSYIPEHYFQLKPRLRKVVKGEG